MKKFYGVYNRNDNEMFVMDDCGVWRYLEKEASALFQTYNVTTDGKTVVISEPSAGANGTLNKEDIDEFFAGFEEDSNILIRPTSEYKFE